MKLGQDGEVDVTALVGAVADGVPTLTLTAAQGQAFVEGSLTVRQLAALCHTVCASDVTGGVGGTACRKARPAQQD